MTLSTERLSMTLEACATELATLRAQRNELLNALELSVATIERIAVRHGPFSSVDGTLSVARAAIAKAKGA